MTRLAPSLVAPLFFLSFSSAQEIGTPVQSTHEVVRGESLWVLAERYLGDPFQWPLIFEANRGAIQNPDSIVPGQILVIPGTKPTAEAGEPAEGATVQLVTVTTGAEEVVSEDPPVIRVLQQPPPAEPSTGRRVPSRTVFYRGPETGAPAGVESRPGRTTFHALESESVLSPARPVSGKGMASGLLPVPGGIVFGSAWLEPEGVRPTGLGALSGFSSGQSGRGEGSRLRLQEQVKIHLDGAPDLREGDLLQSFRVVREEEGLGTVVRPTGLLSVTKEGEEVQARLTAEYGRVRVGDRVRLAPPYGLRPGAQATPVTSNVTASVLGFAVDRFMYGIGALAFLDVGELEGITIGDEFKAFDNRPGSSFGMETATLQVVVVHGNVSTARVTKLKRATLTAGDRLRLVKKMQ